MRKKLLQKCCSLFLCFSLLISFAGATSISSTFSPNKELLSYTFDDGSKVKQFQVNENTQIIQSYSPDSEEVSTLTLTVNQNTRIAITDKHKVEYNTDTGIVRVFKKNIVNGITTYSFLFDFNLNDEDDEDANISAYSGPAYVVKTYKANCYDYQMYTFNNNGHDLWKGGSAASAAPNKFLSECQRFQTYAEDCDAHTYALIDDAISAIPGGAYASFVVKVGKLIYNAFVTGNTSADIADILVAFVTDVAGYVCKPASTIAAFIDTVGLLVSLRGVQDNWKTVYNGMT